MANHLEHHLALRILLRQKALVEQLLCWLVLNGRTCDAKWTLRLPRPSYLTRRRRRSRFGPGL